MFNQGLDEPTVKRHILGNKGEFEQENKIEVSLSLTSKKFRQVSEDLGDDSRNGVYAFSASYSLHRQWGKGSVEVNSFI